MTISPRHMDLLLSRLFHDLIGPVSATRSTMELVREFGAGDVGAEAMELASASLEQAIARLTLFRVAFGAAEIAGGGGNRVRGYPLRGGRLPGLPQAGTADHA